MGDLFDVNDAIADIKTRKLTDPNMRDVSSVDDLPPIGKSLGFSDIQSALEDNPAYKDGKAKGMEEAHIDDINQTTMPGPQYKTSQDRAAYIAGYIAGRLLKKKGLPDDADVKVDVLRIPKGPKTSTKTSPKAYPYARSAMIVGGYILAFILAMLYLVYGN